MSKARSKSKPEAATAPPTEMTEGQREPLTEAEAKRLTRQIKAAHGKAQAAVDKLVELVQRARDGHAHKALGYPSWTAYAQAELTLEIRLSRATRQELVVQLSALGMSTRSIAATIGASKNTVTGDLSQSGTPDAETIGADGKAYQRKASTGGRPKATARRRGGSVAETILASTESFRAMLSELADAEDADAAAAELERVIADAQAALTRLRERAATTPLAA